MIDFKIIYDEKISQFDANQILKEQDAHLAKRFTNGSWQPFKRTYRCIQCPFEFKLSLSDADDPRKTFLYQLSMEPSLDRVPRIDTHRITTRIEMQEHVQMTRFDVSFVNRKVNLDSMIGISAHICFFEVPLYIDWCRGIIGERGMGTGQRRMKKEGIYLLINQIIFCYFFIC